MLRTYLGVTIGAYDADRPTRTRPQQEHQKIETISAGPLKIIKDQQGAGGARYVRQVLCDSAKRQTALLFYRQSPEGEGTADDLRQLRQQAHQPSAAH